VHDDDRPGIEGFNRVDGGEPIIEPLPTGFDEIRMRAIVDGVASDDEADRWHVTARCVIGVGVSNVHGDNRVAFNVEGAAIQYFGSEKLIRDLSWKPSLPVFDGIGGEGFVQSLDHVR
jgi:hypothetical protein